MAKKRDTHADIARRLERAVDDGPVDLVSPDDTTPPQDLSESGDLSEVKETLQEIMRAVEALQNDLREREAPEPPSIGEQPTNPIADESGGVVELLEEIKSGQDDIKQLIGTLLSESSTGKRAIL